LLAGDQAVRDYHIDAYPTLAVIDRRGIIAAYRVGGMSENELRSVIEKGLAGAPERVTLAAPAQLTPAPGAVFDVFPRKTSVTWTAVPGAASYAIEWDYRDNQGWWSDRNQGHAPALKTKDTALSFDFVGAQPGRWRVYAIGPNGEQGAKSAWREFLYKR
jgi:hypothetical protein